MILRRNVREEYTLAFDLLTAELERNGPPRRVVAALSAPVFVEEVLFRSAWPLVLAATSPSVSPTVQPWIQAGYPAALGVDVALRDSMRAVADGSRFDAAIWAAPAQATWGDDFALLDELLLPGGWLCILSAGRLGQATRLARRAWQPGEPDWYPAALPGHLAAQGYQRQKAIGLGGVESMSWAAAARVAGRLGSAEREDRYTFAARESLIRKGDGAERSSLLLLLAQKGTS